MAERALSRHGVALAAIAALSVAHLLPFRTYLTDDTFIHLQFAKNLIAGQGFSFNAGEPTYGATSPLWVFLLAALGVVIPGSGQTPADASHVPALAWAAKAIGALATVLSVILMARIGRTLGWSPNLSLVPAALLAVHAWSARWAISGMETPLVLLLVIASFHALARTLLHGASAWPGGVLLGLATLARPECWILVMLALVSAWTGVRVRRSRAWAGIVGGTALVTVPWLALAWTWFHRLTPNTSAAKAGVLLDPALGLSALQTSLRALLATDAFAIGFAVVSLAMAGPALFRIESPARRAFWTFVFLWPVALVLGYAVGGVQVVSRYLVPAAPSLILIGTAAAWWCAPELLSVRRKIVGKPPVSGAESPRVRAASVLALVVLATAQNVAVTARLSAPHARRHTAGLLASLGQLGVWARTSTARGTLFAVSDIGAFGYYSDRPVLDLFGLVTPAMAPVTVREGYDAVVARLLYEGIGRPEYLVDRAQRPARLADPDDPENPYQFVRAVEIPDLGITRPATYVYSLYTIDWARYDRLHPRLASHPIEIPGDPRYSGTRLEADEGARGGGGNRIGQNSLPSQASSSL
ncbi:MAG TPA: hypothetical protein VFP58_09790 [Candidatus Eisenbacteria bacterium]|nr:hypothetical protein [Candidatus Eisenbacteria bacterium]